MSNKEISIGKRRVGSNYPCFIIAEAGVNHNGSLEMALQLVDAAVDARADAVKFQTFIAEKIVTPNASKADYQKETTGYNESQLDMLKKLELSFDDIRKIKNYCENRGIIFLSTPFDDESVDFLNEIGVLAFKIASGDITNHPFLEKIARKGKPIIISTGMCYLSEVDEAVRVLQNAGCDQMALLHCVSIYPADSFDVNLKAMQTMAAAFKVPIGYSDHTMGIEIGVAAAALGACILEKHFTLDKNLPGPDHRASLEPSELNALIRAIRTVEVALGHGRKEPVEKEVNNKISGRRSIVIARDLSAGERLTNKMIVFKRPGTGLPPSMVNYVIGRNIKVDIHAGTILKMDMLD